MVRGASAVVAIVASSWLAGCAARSRAQAPTVPSASASTKARSSSTSSEGQAPAQAAEKTGSSEGAPAASASTGEPAGAVGAVGAVGAAGAAGAKTPDERRDALDRDLANSLSKFDAMLLKEQQEVAAKRAEHGTGAGAASGSGAGGEGEASGGSAGGTATAAGTAGGSAASASKDKATGSSSSSRGGRGRDVATAPEGAPTEEQGDASRVPADVGDGRNDDVVARQIREAAIAEQDPAIRAKLWDEYRRYKRGES
jgi:hypothetical protein